MSCRRLSDLVMGYVRSWRREMQCKYRRCRSNGVIEGRGDHREVSITLTYV